MFLGYIDPGNGFKIFSAGGSLLAFGSVFLGLFLAFFKKIFNFFKKKWRLIIIIVVIAAFGSVTIRLAMMNKHEAQFDKKIIILGFDGLSPVIVEKMMREGRLPHFAKLKEMGSYAHLATTNPAQSPVAWSGFATGQNPGKHGVCDFIVRNPKTYELSLSLSKMEGNKAKPTLKAKGFWWYSSKKKIPTVVIGCPMTFPPEKIYGRMLSGMGVTDILGTEGTFSFYTTEDIKNQKITGGKVFPLKKAETMISYFTGPQVTNIFGKTQTSQVPFKITLKEDKKSVDIQYEHTRFTLKENQWSAWQDIYFSVGFLKSMNGIMKFYLVQASPELKLYVSPINLDPRNSFFDISHPKNYSKELAGAIGLYHTQGMPIDTWVMNEGFMTEKVFLEHVDDVFQERKAMLDMELSHLKEGILFCYFGIPDTIQHMFWRYIDSDRPGHQQDPPSGYQDTVARWYQKMDEVLGEVMAGLEREDILIALSDHGFDAFRRAAHVNSWLHQNGYLSLKSSGAYDEKDLLGSIDWSRTKAYAIGFGGIYLNQQGREGQGIVKPREAQALKDEIAKKLSDWIDEKDNQRVIHKVYQREDIFWGNHAKEMPDLYIGFNIGYEASWQTALGGVSKELIEENLKKWSGSHLFDPDLVPGVFLSNRKVTKNNPSLYDVAPTILKVIGYSDKELKAFGMDGEALFAK